MVRINGYRILGHLLNAKAARGYLSLSVHEAVLSLIQGGYRDKEPCPRLLANAQAAAYVACDFDLWVKAGPLTLSQP